MGSILHGRSRFSLKLVNENANIQNNGFRGLSGFNFKEEHLFKFNRIRPTIDGLLSFLKVENFNLIDDWVTGFYKNIDGLIIHKGWKYKEIPNDVYMIIFTFDIDFRPKKVQYHKQTEWSTFF